MSAAVCGIQDVLEALTGKRIAEVRLAMGFPTQKALADHLNALHKRLTNKRENKYRQNTVSRWESETSRPLANDLYFLAYGLRVTCETLGMPLGSDITLRSGKVIKPQKPDLSSRDEDE